MLDMANHDTNDLDLAPNQFNYGPTCGVGNGASSSWGAYAVAGALNTTVGATFSAR